LLRALAAQHGWLAPDVPLPEDGGSRRDSTQRSIVVAVASSLITLMIVAIAGTIGGLLTQGALIRMLGGIADGDTITIRAVQRTGGLAYQVEYKERSLSWRGHMIRKKSGNSGYSREKNRNLPWT
jgi:hypothetical protein